MTSDSPSPSPAAEHRAEAPERIQCAVVTVSDTRTEADDRSGRTIIDALEAAGHEVALYQIVKDEPDQIIAVLDEAARLKTIQAVLITGGTGLAPRDLTCETIEGLLAKKIDGFGELFRMLSYEEIGAAAMLSRAVAGVWSGMVLFSMPGSTAAVRLAMEKLIVPELGHIVSHARG